MADLEQLMQLPGALAAFRFSDQGELEDHRLGGDHGLDAQTLDMLCHMCVANIAIATMQARGWEHLTGAQGFYPINGFTLVGFDWSAVTNDHHGVVLANDRADYQAAYTALAGAGA